MYLWLSSSFCFNSSVAKTKAHGTKVVKHLANKFNLTFNAFGEEVSEPGAPSSGTLTLSDSFGTALEPAPFTPTGPDAAPYRLLSGTIKATYNSHRSLQGKDNILVSPSMPSGNTGEFGAFFTSISFKKRKNQILVTFGILRDISSDTIIITLARGKTGWLEEFIRSTNVCLFDWFTFGSLLNLCKIDRHCD